jgi:uncharacterized damage-inducible protein DinB
MSELENLLTGAGAFAAPKAVLEAIDPKLVLAKHPGASHSIYEEVWHLAYWQQISLDWARGIETPVPTHASAGFPTGAQIDGEPWDRLRQRFLDGATDAAAITSDAAGLERDIRCPSPPGHPIRTMTVREQLENLASHNAYHLGRVVLLRQMNGAWPPPSGGFSW